MHPKVPVHTSLGWVSAEDLAPGDAVAGPVGWVPVRAVRRAACSEWFRVTVDDAPVFAAVVTGSHAFYRANGATVRAADLRLGDLLRTDGDHAVVTGLSLLEETRDLVGIEVPDPHRHYMGLHSLLCHNGFDKP